MRTAIKQVYSKQYMLAKPKSDSAHISFSTHAVYVVNCSRLCLWGCFSEGGNKVGWIVISSTTKGFFNCIAVPLNDIATEQIALLRYNQMSN